MGFCLKIVYLYRKFRQKPHTPVLATLLCGLGAIIILAVNVQLPKVFELVTSIAILWANLAYWIVVAVQLKKQGCIGTKGSQYRREIQFGQMGIAG